MAEQTESKTQFGIQRIYVKDLSFEIPKAPEIFRIKWEPNFSLDLTPAYTKIEDNLFEVTLTVSVKANTAGEVAFIAEVTQAGIFFIEGLAPDALDHILGAYCPNLLFPYAREAIDNLSNRGSFPAVALSPINFDALYEHRKNQAQQNGSNNENVTADDNPTIN